MRVLKWDVPVDDKPHAIGNGKVVLVECQYSATVVQVWTEESDDRGISPKRSVQVFGTGHTIPSRSNHVGSVVTGGGSLVWHVYEVEW